MLKLCSGLLLVLQAAAQNTAGLHTSVDIAVLNQAKEVFFDEVVKIINNLPIPDLADDSGNYLKDNTFEIVEAQEYASFFTDVDKNAVILANKKISGKFRSQHFRYKVAPLLVSKGHAEVDMNTVDIEVGMAFSTKTLRNGRVVPKVSTVDIKCDINRHDIKIHLFGNLLTDIGSLFEVFFKDTVAELIEDTVTLTLNRVVPLITNNLIDSTEGVIPVPFVQNWMLDWQTPESCVVTETNIGVGSKCLFFDKLIGEEEPQVKIPDMPLHSTEHIEKFQTYLSSYTIDGFCASLLEVMDIQGWVRSQMLHGLVTTTTLDALLPGMIKYYGAGVPVDTYFVMHKLGDFRSFEGNQEMKGTATLDLQFWVQHEGGYPEYAAGLTLTDASFGFNALVEDMDITLKVTHLHIDQVDVLHCAWRDLRPSEIKLKINVGERLLQPILNKFLSLLPIKFPTELFGLFKLERLTLSYYNDYIYAGITPIFIGPTPKTFIPAPVVDSDLEFYLEEDDETDFEPALIMQN